MKHGEFGTIPDGTKVEETRLDPDQTYRQITILRFSTSPRPSK